ncbi:acetyl-CoA hydrolase/transferase C-terminal domain-containing protein [Desulfosporosinus hippei]|uniref:Acetyl-CoA hydrolase/transferase C-terminal domain-containing protein n=1 Tax=Desulfosporosinus hippei DSM 8344 TaxID=1121419 RepID=A0A1G7WDK9_9FIRM|nr:acetyl-CoA hydrolase/transferase C-terminal domain-containing protein [Desulfosporosinus hippei]SDG69914.1 Acetyl-CoA hydrolase/transferase C-terminal domain-containing protein [Desulfosporosinus hippei DSM 8344]
MYQKQGLIYDDVKKCVTEVINYVGKNVIFSIPLALGKPVIFTNELYRQAKENSEINLKIITALTLEKPKGHTDLERRFLGPLADRVFAGVPEFDFILDFRAGKLPKNVEIFEFFSKAGGYLNSPVAQQNHLATNYTHAIRDALALGANVFAQLISPREFNGKNMYSMGCNTDVCIAAINEFKCLKAQGKKVAIIGEANINMPFMYGDAVVEADSYDIILQGSQFNYELFCPPKDPVALSDHMIGINVSTLIKDGGTIQVGIGALGDAIVSGLIMRNEHNELYQDVLQKSGIKQRYRQLIDNWGGIGVFQKGLYGSSEMFVDAFMQMYKSKILKRKVYESVPIMKLINEGRLASDHIPPDIIDQLITLKALNSRLSEEDFKFLTQFGILKQGLIYENGIILDQGAPYSTDMSDEKGRNQIQKLLGQELLGGQVIIGAFFVGPKAFYQALNDMSEDERKLFGMSGVDKVNQLYGGEELRALQRKDARFVNTGMVSTVLGAIASDQLEDGRVISGIGGQYNFVAMGHALPDARVIMMIKSTKGSGKSLKSNIVFSYGHCSVPKHLRDIIVTEYGIADVRSKPEKEVIAELIKVADSRFQNKLLDQAKKAGKIPKDYEIPQEYRNNTPEKITALLKPYQSQGIFQPFPFGTDLTEIEIALGGALKGLKKLANGNRLKMATGLIKEFFRPIPASSRPYLERLNLQRPSSMKEKIMRKLVIFSLRNNNIFNTLTLHHKSASNQVKDHHAL